MKTKHGDENLRIFTLEIKGFNPTALRPEVVGQYLGDLAKLVGPDVDSRFYRITRGSTNLAVCVPKQQEPDVRNRAFLIKTGQAPPEAMKANESLLERLARDKAKSARLLDHSKNNLIVFPISSSIPEKTVVLTKSGSLQGQVIKIGGKQETVPVQIEDVDGHVYHCQAKRAIARELGRCIFGQTVRVFGSGKWFRDESGTWQVTDFNINSVESSLEDASLSQALETIARIPSKWKDTDDPMAELDRIRHGIEGDE